jgi:hypothetical protein
LAGAVQRRILSPVTTPATPTPFRAGAARVNEPLASILVAFGLDRCAIPDPGWPACVAANAGPLRIEGMQAELRIQDRELLLDIPQRIDPHAERAWNEPGTFRLEDGTTITAKFTNYRSTSMSLRAGGLSRAATTFTAGVWLWSSRPATAWVGRLPGLKFEQHNLGLWDRHRNAWRRDGLRVQGRYTWYVMGDGRKDDPVLVLDAGATPPEMALLRADFAALEFSLGCPTKLDLLVGVDDALQPVGALGPHLGFRERAGEETWPPIPDGLDGKARVSVLVPKLAAKLADPDDRVFIAVAGYMDALVDHLDGAYLKAQVALEAFCKSLGPEVGKARVTSKDDWAAWVASVEPAIRSMAIDKDAGDALVGAVRSAMHPSTSSIVPAALEMLGMKVPSEVLAEVRRRSVPVHEFVMSRKDEHPILEGLPRLRMVQALLGAVAARAAGYEGPVLGWTQDAAGRRAPLPWWTPTDDSEASSFYVAERGLNAAEPGAAPAP